MLEAVDKLELVDQFCYMRDMLKKGGGHRAEKRKRQEQ